MPKPEERPKPKPEKTRAIDARAELRERAVVATKAFKPGLYRHKKGGLYNALCLVTHHETRLPMVLYVSLAYGSTNVRPLVGWHGDPDGWTDLDPVTGEPRFRYLGELPSDMLAVDRVTDEGT
jgi:hypothetical protein